MTEIIQGVLTKIEFYYQDVNPAVHYKLGLHNGAKSILYLNYNVLNFRKIFQNSLSSAKSNLRQYAFKQVILFKKHLFLRQLTQNMTS